MALVPTRPKIYHITHVRNLPLIVSAGCVWSDAKRIELGLECHLVGMSTIKRRRLEELPVPCHAGTRVGQYVPFYFCPRSVMLYILHRGNHPDVNYREGQQPIIHLEADLHATVKWAAQHHVRWAFSDTNAGARYADFYSTLDRLKELNWSAIDNTDFRNADVKEGKQAEFLLFERFPLDLVERIGVNNPTVLGQVTAALRDAPPQPVASVEPGWYF